MKRDERATEFIRLGSVFFRQRKGEERTIVHPRNKRTISLFSIKVSKREYLGPGLFSLSRGSNTRWIIFFFTFLMPWCPIKSLLQVLLDWVTLFKNWSHPSEFHYKYPKETGYFLLFVAVTRWLILRIKKRRKKSFDLCHFPNHWPGSHWILYKTSNVMLGHHREYNTDLNNRRSFLIITKSSLLRLLIYCSQKKGTSRKKKSGDTKRKAREKVKRNQIKSLVLL
jgi:hypothetical protein